MARLSAAFSLTSMWLVAAADIGANLNAASNLFLGHSDRFLLSFCHFEVSLGAIRVNWIECTFIVTPLAVLGRPSLFPDCFRPIPERICRDGELPVRVGRIDR